MWSPTILKPFEIGDTVWHGTSSETKFENLDLVSWVSDSESVAEEFVDWHELEGLPRILEYSFIGSPLLVHITSVEDINNLISWAEIEGGLGVGYLEGDTAGLAEVLCDIGLDGWHIPNNFPSGSDTLLCEPQKWLSLVAIHHQTDLT